LRVYLTIFILFYSANILAEDYEAYSREDALLKFSPVLSILKKAIETNDVKLLNSIVSYPFNISFPETYVAPEGNIRFRGLTVKDYDDLKEKYDSIFIHSVRFLVQCITPNNMRYDKNKGFSAAHGRIWFFDIIEPQTGIRKYALSSILVDPKNSKWAIEECPGIYNIGS